MKNNNQYATVTWTPEDISLLRPSWSEERCREFLEENDNHIRDRLVEHGWEVIESLLPVEGE